MQVQSHNSMLARNRKLLKSLLEMGFEKPSPIQEACLNAIQDGHSILATAKNGTGKSTGFIISILDRHNPCQPGIQGLILVPTRELALQTSSVVKEIGKHMNIQCMVSTGGTSLREDIMRLYNEVHILVATPGRVLDLVNKNVCNLKQCHKVAMDEADKLLCPESQPIIEELVKFLPPERQILMHSATFPSRVIDFKNRFMADAHEINLMEELTLKGVSQYYAFVEERQKVHCLNGLFSKLQINQAIIFCNSVTRVELLAKMITELGHPALTLHSEMINRQRADTYHSFCIGEYQCLVTLHEMTTGLHIKAVNVVINFDFPKNSQQYFTSCSRGAHFRRDGLAISLVTEESRSRFCSVEEELDTEIQPLQSVDSIEPSLYTENPAAEDVEAGSVW